MSYSTCERQQRDYSYRSVAYQQRRWTFMRSALLQATTDWKIAELWSMRSPDTIHRRYAQARTVARVVPVAAPRCVPGSVRDRREMAPFLSGEGVRRAHTAYAQLHRYCNLCVVVAGAVAGLDTIPPVIPQARLLLSSATQSLGMKLVWMSARTLHSISQATRANARRSIALRVSGKWRRGLWQRCGVAS